VRDIKNFFWTGGKDGIEGKRLKGKGRGLTKGGEARVVQRKKSMRNLWGSGEMGRMPRGHLEGQVLGSRGEGTRGGPISEKVSWEKKRRRTLREEKPSPGVPGLSGADAAACPRGKT